MCTHTHDSCYILQVSEGLMIRSCFVACLEIIATGQVLVPASCEAAVAKGQGFDPHPGSYVQVSLGNALKPRLLLVVKLATCMTAAVISVQIRSCSKVI